VTKEEYKKSFKEDEAVGWNAIDKTVDKTYDNKEPRYHWGTILRYSLGGQDPLDGISGYESTKQKEHIHFCTYGFSELYYNEDSAGQDFSGFGFELTFRLQTKLPLKTDPIWVATLLQGFARYIFDSGKWFEEYQYLDLQGSITDQSSIYGFIFVKDVELQQIDTAHGKVEFLQLFGITNSELETIKNQTKTPKDIIDEHRKNNPYLITDINR